MSQFGTILDGILAARGVYVWAEPKGGKSRLLKAYRQLCEDRNILCACIDLAEGHFSTVAAVLNRLAAQIGGSAGFPSFQQFHDALLTRTVQLSIQQSKIVGSDVTFSERSRASVEESLRLVDLFANDLTQLAKVQRIILILDHMDSSKTQRDLLAEVLIPRLRSISGVVLISEGRDEASGDLVQALPRISFEDYWNYQQQVGTTISERLAKEVFDLAKGDLVFLKILFAKGRPRSQPAS